MLPKNNLCICFYFMQQSFAYFQTKIYTFRRYRPAVDWFSNDSHRLLWHLLNEISLCKLIKFNVIVALVRMWWFFIHAIAQIRALQPNVATLNHLSLSFFINTHSTKAIFIFRYAIKCLRVWMLWILCRRILSIMSTFYAVHTYGMYITLFHFFFGMYVCLHMRFGLCSFRFIDFILCSAYFY